MNWLFWKQKKLCLHEWFELETGEDYIDYTTCGIVDGRHEEVTHLYCPKFDERKRVSTLEGRLILKAKDIKNQHKSR